MDYRKKTTLLGSAKDVDNLITPTNEEALPAEKPETALETVDNVENQPPPVTTRKEVVVERLDSIDGQI